MKERRRALSAPRGGPRLVLTASAVRPQPDPAQARWKRRPVLALAVRLVALLVPFAAAVAAGAAVTQWTTPHGLAETIAWVLCALVVSTTVLFAVDAGARRLLPLHRLLLLCLAFPDRAPSRLRVAVRAARAGRPEQVAGQGHDANAAVAAERVVTLLGAMAVHDRRTRGHSERVCAYTELLADHLGLPDGERERLRWAALIHDVGKLTVPRRVLNKPDRPTVDEWRILQAHPERGARIAAPLRDWLGRWSETIAQHHERWDGEGYPHGLRGDEICLGARIVAVADAFEVMTAPRPYRLPVDAATARAELARCAGRQFDPDVVRAFLAVGLPRLRRAMGPLAWLALLPFIGAGHRLRARLSAASGRAATTTAVASGVGLLVISGPAGPGASGPPAMASPEGAGRSPATATGPHEVAQALGVRAPGVQALDAQALGPTTAVASSSRLDPEHGAVAASQPMPAYDPVDRRAGSTDTVSSPRRASPDQTPPAQTPPGSSTAPAADDAPADQGAPGGTASSESKPADGHPRATPADPATPASPGGPGRRATRATPATPATPPSGR